MVSGPPQPLTVGDLGEFSIQVSNPGVVALSKVQLAVQTDAGLELAFASQGGQPVDGRLMWTINSMPPRGTPETFQIQCRCKEASPRACVRAQVTSAEGAEHKSEACIQIHPAVALGGSLSLSMADLRDPIALGKEETYEVRVTNVAQMADRDVVLKVTLPPEMALNQLHTTGPGGGFAKFEGQTVQFKPVAQLFPGETLSYRVGAVTKQAGKVQVTATLSSKNVKQSSRTESTEIFAERP